MNRPAPDFTFYYNDDALIEACQLEKAAVIFGNPNREQLSCCKNLKWVQLGSAGADAYVKEGFLPAGTILTNASGAYGPAIAEYMVAVSFSLFNNLPLYRDNQLSAVWRERGYSTQCRRFNSAVCRNGRYWKRICQTHEGAWLYRLRNPADEGGKA